MVTGRRHTRMRAGSAVGVLAVIVVFAGRQLSSSRLPSVSACRVCRPVVGHVRVLCRLLRNAACHGAADLRRCWALTWPRSSSSSASRRSRRIWCAIWGDPASV